MTTDGDDRKAAIRAQLVALNLATVIQTNVDDSDGEVYRSIGVRTNEEAADIALEFLLSLTPTQPDRDQIARVLAESDVTAAFGSGIHSWRCEYPERYGPCNCLDGLIDDLAALFNGGTKP